MHVSPEFIPARFSRLSDPIQCRTGVAQISGLEFFHTWISFVSAVYVQFGERHTSVSQQDRPTYTDNICLHHYTNLLSGHVSLLQRPGKTKHKPQATGQTYIIQTIYAYIIIQIYCRDMSHFSRDRERQNTSLRQQDRPTYTDNICLHHYTNLLSGHVYVSLLPRPGKTKHKPQATRQTYMYRQQDRLTSFRQQVSPSLYKFIVNETSHFSRDILSYSLHMLYVARTERDTQTSE